MHLDIAHRMRIDIGMTKDIAENSNLIALERPRDGICLSAVVGVGTRYDGENGISVRLCVF